MTKITLASLATEDLNSVISGYDFCRDNNIFPNKLENDNLTYFLQQAVKRIFEDSYIHNYENDYDGDYHYYNHTQGTNGRDDNIILKYKDNSQLNISLNWLKLNSMVIVESETKTNQLSFNLD